MEFTVHKFPSYPASPGEDAPANRFEPLPILEYIGFYFAADRPRASVPYEYELEQFWNAAIEAYPQVAALLEEAMEMYARVRWIQFVAEHYRLGDWAPAEFLEIHCRDDLRPKIEYSNGVVLGTLLGVATHGFPDRWMRLRKLAKKVMSAKRWRNRYKSWTA